MSEAKKLPEPSAKVEPSWTDDNILICGKHSITFTKEMDECFICTNRAPSADAALSSAHLEIAQCHRDMDDMRKLLVTRAEASRLDEANTALSAAQEEIRTLKALLNSK